MSESEKSKDLELSDILGAIKDLKVENKKTFEKISKRIDKLEEKSKKKTSKTVNVSGASAIHTEEISSGLSENEESESGEVTINRRSKSSTGVSLKRKQVNTSAFASIQSDDLFAEFQAIKESRNRQRLPKDLKCHGSSRGVKSTNKEVARVLGASGRYIETCVKLVSDIQQGIEQSTYNPMEDIDDLLICLIAHLRFVQEEQCLLSVAGDYGPRTQAIFKTIHSNPGRFTPSVIEELRTSATLSAIPQEPNQQGARPRENYYQNNFRGRGGAFRGCGRGYYNQFQQGQQGQFDNPGFRTRYVPAERNNNSDG